jgi:putative redox protein
LKVELKRINEPYHFEATNQTGNSIHIDASPQIGGTDKGVRPMELLLMGLAGCASIDVISILRKQRFTIEDFKVTVDGERETEKDANLFTDIVVNFFVKGDVEEEKLIRAIELSLGKYCSVSKTLEKTAKINYKYSIERQI